MSKSDTIDAMTAGYWLDALAATRVMGWHLDDRGLDWCDDAGPVAMAVKHHGYEGAWQPSKDIVAAKEVLKELERKGWEWDIRFTDKKYKVAIMKPEWATDNPYQSKVIPSATAETIPLAICKAAIKLSHHEEYEGTE